MDRLPEADATTASTDLRTYLSTLARWRVVIALCLVTLPTAAYVWSHDERPVFEATTKLKVQPSAVDTSLLTDFTPTFPGTQPAIAAAGEVKTTAIARAAIAMLDGEVTSTREALEQIDVQVSADSGILTLVARAATGAGAARLANAFAAAFKAAKKRVATALVDDAIRGLQARRAGLSAADAVERRESSDQLQRLQTLRESQGNNATIIEPAQAASAPVSPHPIRTAGIAGLIGLLLALLLVRLLTALDGRIRGEEEVERIMEAPVLATIPRRAFSAGPGSADGRNAFETLRANLTFLAIDSSLSSVLVTSPQMGDGKTTVATNLAISYAQLGKDVVIVDADLRRPQVGAMLGIQPGAGLAEVLVGTISALDALVDVEVDGGGGPGRLRVLASGTTPPNPSELLASDATQAVLRELEEHADILIIDSPPTTMVSDAIALLDLVSGVLAVVRLHGTDRQRLQRLRATMRTTDTRTLGVALTGASSRDSSGYGYDGYAAAAEREARSLNGASRERVPAGASRRQRPASGRKAREPDRAPSQRGDGWFS
jgi:capsular exopolysaccharide synthesis family protein